MQRRWELKTREEVDLEDKVRLRAFERAMQLEGKRPFDEMGWRGRLYIWWRLDAWHRTLRPMPRAVRMLFPSEASLRYIGFIVGILAGVATIAQKCGGH